MLRISNYYTIFRRKARGKSICLTYIQCAFMDFTDKRYHFEPDKYNGKKVIWIRFEKDNELISYLRNHTNAKWSASKRSWYVTDSSAMLVRIEQGKGKKDRVVPLPESVLEDMRSYYKDYRPKIYLFEGQHGGQYFIRSAQQIFKSGLKKGGVKKQIGIHGLRHSYATHLLETGTDMRFIKDLLGHHSIKTTEIYTHVTDLSKSKIKSPLDFL